MPDARRGAILDAARQAFSRYGYARTAMADIAALAHVSRPALYAHFRNKEDLLRSLARVLVDEALAAADAAWPAGLDATRGLAAATLAKDRPLFRLIHLSPHGAEILAQQETLTADLHAEMEQRFSRLIAQRTGVTPTLGRSIARALDGLKQNARTEAEFTGSVRQLTALIGAGLERGATPD